jgi:hypothetical protein
MAMNSFDNEVETNYNANFRNCKREDYDYMLNSSDVMVSDHVEKETDDMIGVKLCPDMSNGMLDKMYLQN